MYTSVQRPLGVSASRTLLAAFAILALVTSALGLSARPAAAGHGGGHVELESQFVGTTSDCEFEGEVVWHFVANQLAPGTTSGSLTAEFENEGTVTDSEGEPAGQGRTQHFTVTTPGNDTLLGAEATFTEEQEGANLVLSDIQCPEGPAQGQIEVVKALDPTDDEGLFDLLIGGVVHKEDASHDEGTGPVTVDAGEVVVGETAGTDTDLVDYTFSISCVLRGTETAVTATQGDGASWTVNVGEGQDIVCTITNTRVQQEPVTELLQVHKVICEGEETSTRIDDPLYVEIQALQTDPIPENCRFGAASFLIYVDEDGDGMLDEGEPLATNPDLTDGGFTTDATTGTAEIELAIGHYILVEPATDDFAGGQKAFEIREGFRTVIWVWNTIGEEDQGEGFVKVIKFFCDFTATGEWSNPTFLPLEGDTDEKADGISLPPNFDEDCALGGTEGNPEAQFSLNGKTFWTGIAGDGSDAGHAVVSIAPGTYTLSELQPIEATGPDITVVEDETVTVIVINFEEEQAAEGRIDIVKQLEEGECPLCPTRTPGFWFNPGGGGGTEMADDLLGEMDPSLITFPIGEGGTTTFDSVAKVQAYLEWDRSGEDGEMGLSGTGQLLRQYLALLLNVAATDCPWGEIFFGDMSVLEWLDAAHGVLLEGGEDEEIKDALDAINNADLGDGTLECPETAAGGPVAGVVFELWREGDEEPFRVSDATDGDGTTSFTGLPLGTYTIVERDPPGFECTIVSATVNGDPVEVNADGSVTVTLTEENATITLTLVNACEEIQDVVEDEFGEIIAIKVTDEDEPSEAFDFTLDGAAFGSIMSGELLASGDLAEGEHFLAEVLTEAHVEAGWSLNDIFCVGIEGRIDLDAAASVLEEDEGLFDPDVVIGDASATINLAADTTVVCVFVNIGPEGGVIGEQTGRITVVKVTVPSGGTGFDFTLSGDEDDTATLNHGQLASWVLDAGGTFTVTEEGADDWQLASIVCSAGATVSLSERSFTVAELGDGAQVTCVFTNVAGEMGVQPGGQQPGGEQDVRGGQGLPDTATGQSGEPTAPLPVALLAVMGLAAATVGSRRMLAERRA